MATKQSQEVETKTSVDHLPRKVVQVSGSQKIKQKKSLFELQKKREMKNNVVEV